jgi:hypothetical protein
LTGFEAFIGFVDDVKTTTAAHQLIFLVAIAQGFKRIADFHRRLHKFVVGFPRSREHMGQARSCQAATHRQLAVLWGIKIAPEGDNKTGLARRRNGVISAQPTRNQEPM